MGAGKGDVKGYVAVVKPGRIIFEVSGITKEEAAQYAGNYMSGNYLRPFTVEFSASIKF